MSSKRKSGPTALSKRPPGYAEWLTDLKARVHAAQQRAALSVNRELLSLYWQIGRDILDRQAREGWGAGVLDQVSADLRAAFPEMKGFSRSNLKYMRAFADAWPDFAIGQQPVGQLPWGHQLVLLTKLKTREARLAHAEQALALGWSRNALALHIENRSLERSGKALTNFEQQLPQPQSDLARESLKDPYYFDFLSLGAEANERDIEIALVKHITQFLLELGVGFAYVGRQFPLEVGGEDFYIDLLFYHLKLRAYVVVELKAGDFKPEHVGKLSFYLSAIDAQLRAPADAPTIGLLLCSASKADDGAALQDRRGLSSCTRTAARQSCSAMAARALAERQVFIFERFLARAFATAMDVVRHLQQAPPTRDRAHLPSWSQSSAARGIGSAYAGRSGR